MILREMHFLAAVADFWLIKSWSSVPLPVFGRLTRLGGIFRGQTINGFLPPCQLRGPDKTTPQHEIWSSEKKISMWITKHHVCKWGSLINDTAGGDPSADSTLWLLVGGQWRGQIWRNRVCPLDPGRWHSPGRPPIKTLILRLISTRGPRTNLRRWLLVTWKIDKFIKQ